LLAGASLYGSAVHGVACVTPADDQTQTAMIELIVACQQQKPPISGTPTRMIEHRLKLGAFGQP